MELKKAEEREKGSEEVKSSVGQRDIEEEDKQAYRNTFQNTVVFYLWKWNEGYYTLRGKVFTLPF